MGRSQTNQNKCCHFGREGESKYDFTVVDLLCLGAYLASLPGIFSEASFHYLQISELHIPVCNYSHRERIRFHVGRLICQLQFTIIGACFAFLCKAKKLSGIFSICTHLLQRLEPPLSHVCGEVKGRASQISRNSVSLKCEN